MLPNLYVTLSNVPVDWSEVSNIRMLREDFPARIFRAFFTSKFAVPSFALGKRMWAFSQFAETRLPTVTSKLSRYAEVSFPLKFTIWAASHSDGPDIGTGAPSIG